MLPEGITYYDATVSLSKEARIGIWVGIFITLLVFLLDPKAPSVRVLACIFLFIFAVLILADSDWVKQRSGNLSIFVDAGLPERLSYPRLFIAILIIGVSVFGLAMVTWPPKDVPLQQITLVGQPTSSADSISKAIGIPNPPNKLTPNSDTPKGSPPSKQSVPKPKPPPESKPHPIIVVSKSQVTVNPDTNKIDIVVTLMNTSIVGANVHLTADVTWNDKPTEGTVDTRDVAIAPSPFIFELHFSTTPNAQGEIEFINRTSKLAILINASYPDEGGITTYRFEGVVVPQSDILDDAGSGWTSEPAKK